ncbi:MAG: type I glutamate--ammonia ligase [Promethearchaeota archaeon Loki_b32]|nr:MAG: type I glutamate--ammonia ligase [Candidatus Lokiarchaeota archaeon Loki_b32]
MIEFINVFKEKAIDYIQFQFTTILGEFKSVEFPVKIWDDLKEGTGIDGSSLGFLMTEQSDMRIVPDYNTFAVFPWNPRIGRFICDLTDNNGIPYPTCPRGILKKIISKAKALGYGFQTRPELEWYFITKDFKPSDKAMYMDNLPNDKRQDLRRQITDDMMDMNIGVKTIHHEVGYGQQEVEFTADNALQQADNVQTGKLITKVRAFYKDIISTYMPKPFEQMAGNGLHIHQYLNKNGENAFSDKEKGISDILRYYIGGIQHNINPISAILNPTTNSYKRLTPHHEAPVYVSWGVGNRTALIRVPGYENSARIEYRAGDAMMNIYLGSAILLAAGLDGIKNNIEPNQPTTKNVDLLTDDKRKELKIEKLPENLEESLKAFEKSNFIKKTLGKELMKIYLNFKYTELQEFEIAKSNGNEKDWEYNKYLFM